MKFRNKKTGEMGEARLGNQEIYVETDDKTYCYVKNINEFCREWECVEPAEPLIKDEKIRKAVRAWAEANDINPKYYYETDVKFDFVEHQFKWINTSIEFNDITGLENLEGGERYTIAELCGEEEE